MSILIKNGILLTMDQDDKILREGSVFVEDDRIIDVGNSKDLIKKYKAEEVIDAKWKIVMPGLINAHCHTIHDLLRGLGTDMVVTKRLPNVIWPTMSKLTGEDVYSATLLGCIGAIRTGCTQLIDNYYYRTRDKNANIDRVGEAFEKAGIRAGLWRGYSNRIGIMKPPEIFNETEEEIMAEYLRIVKKWHNKAEQRIKVLLGPGGLLSTTQETLLKVHDLAEKYSCYIQTHAAEESTEPRAFIKLYGKRCVEFLYDLGVLGPNLMIIHSIWLTDKELDLLSRTDTRVVHCPTANMFNTQGVAPVPAMLKRGISVALGTDIYQDMFSTIRCATYIHKVHNLDPFAMTAKCALRMATIDGAKAIGQEKEVGSLEVGKKADIITINYKNPHLIPMHNPIPSIVYCANGNNVDNVIVDGRVIMRNSIITSISECEVLQKAQEVGEKIVGKAALNVRPS